MMNGNKYLFILCTPASGSTALWRFLCTSPNVSYFEREGQWLESVKPFFGTDDKDNIEDRWNPDKTIPWELVKKKWEKVWDTEKSVLLEKSPSHLCRAFNIEKAFPNACFVVMHRNPYAVCEGIKRRHRKQDDSVNYTRIAEFWVTGMRHQLRNIKGLKRVLCLSYEEFTTYPDKIAEQLVGFIADLGRLETGAQLKVFDKELKPTNLNGTQISRLSNNDVREINSVLFDNRDIIEYFGYEYIEPGLARGFTSVASKTSFLAKKIRKRLSGGVAKKK